MDYPALADVISADQEQIAFWSNFLQEPERPAEESDLQKVLCQWRVHRAGIEKESRMNGIGLNNSRVQPGRPANQPTPDAPWQGAGRDYFFFSAGADAGGAAGLSSEAAFSKSRIAEAVNS